MNPVDSRQIVFSGDQEYANTFVSKACSLFDIFVANLKSEGRDSGSSVFDIDRYSYISMSYNMGIGNIHIHAENPANPKYVDIPITKKDIRCHWNKKNVREKVFNTELGIYQFSPPMRPVLFLSHGFGKIVLEYTSYFYVIDNYVFGERIDLVANTGFLNTSFFDDNISTGAYPAIVGTYGQAFYAGADFTMITNRISRHQSLLAYVASNLQASGFLYAVHMLMSLDFFVPAQPGSFVNGHGQTVSGNTPILGGIYKVLLQKSRTKFIGHGVDSDNELDSVPMAEVTCGQSNTYAGGGSTGMWGDQYHGPCIFVGSPDFQQAASLVQDFVGDSSFAYMQGTTELNTLYDERHEDDYPWWNSYEFIDVDFYWFSTRNSATIYLYSYNPDGSVVSGAFAILTNKVIVGGREYFENPPTYHPYVIVPNQSGLPVRDYGYTVASTLKSAKVVGGNRNVFVIVDYRNYIHDQFDYNVFINFGSGFTPINADPTGAYQILAAKDWSEDGLAFVHNADGYQFNFAVLTNDAAAVVKNLLSAHFAEHTDTKKKELRFFRSKNYKWFVLYNAVDDSDEDISGVYYFDGSSVSRVGDATGIEPVEIAPDESYLLMQDKAYGTITGTFDRLVGMFYDKHHYLEMQSRVEDNLRRFVIKNLNNEEIKVLDWGAYSFYETSEDCSIAIITHCSINGVSQSTGSGVTLAVNFVDGPFEFETVCRELSYSFTIDVENGYTQTYIGGETHAPELASPYYGPPDREPPYGRKQISICYCYEDVYVNGKLERRHRHHVMVSPTVKQGIFLGDQYCMHRPGFAHQRVATSAVRTLYRDCRQQRGLDPLMTKQIVTLLALPDGRLYERVTDEVGKVDPLLLVSEEYVTETIRVKQV